MKIFSLGLIGLIALNVFFGTFTTEPTATIILADVSDRVRLETALARRQQLIRDLVRAAERLKYSPCHENTSCYDLFRDYQTQINEINRLIAAMGGRNPMWQDGIKGFIDPRLDVNGTLSQYRHDRERSLLHGKLIASELQVATPTQSSPRAILSMGAPGAGKSTVLNMFGICERDFVRIDADEFKEDLVEYQAAIAARDRLAASRVHEESSLLAKRTRDEAIATRRNFCFDGTLANKSKAIALIKRLQQQGYEVTVFGALVPFHVGKERVDSRAEMTGRFVPPEFVRQAYQKLAQNATAIAAAADFAYLYDTNVPLGESPRLIALAVKGKFHFKNDLVLEELRSEFK